MGDFMVILRSGRNPFEMFLLMACVVTGVVGLLTPRTDVSVIARLLADWQLDAWYAGLVVSGSISLVGIGGKGTTGLLIERIGLATLSCLTLTYSIAVVDAAGVRGVFPALLVAAFAAACIGRFWQIGVDLKLLTRRGATEGRDERRSG